MYMKTCTVCKITKKKEEFYSYKAAKDGKCYRCKSCDTLANQKYREANPEKARLSRRGRQLKYKYGLTLEDYLTLFNSQGRCCAICGITENKVTGETQKHFSFAVDHDHTTGAIRGILCNQCNRGLGMFGDSYESIKKALDYLEKHKTH